MEAVLNKVSLKEDLDLKVSYYGKEKAYDPRDIDITSKRMTLYLVLNRLRHNEFDLETSFQRKKGLWDEVMQSRFIESILIRFPLPTFYFDGSNEDKLLIVDGLQRITTLYNFIIKSEKPLKLKGLEYLPYDNFTYADLPRDLQRRIDETEVPVYIINPGTPSLVKYSIFKRINTGGFVLTPEEIRHALFQGIASDFIEELSNLQIFKEATDNSIKTERMEDRGYIARFLAFTLNDMSEYNNDLDDFLNKAMLKLENTSTQQRELIKLRFINAMFLAKEIFGKEAFRKKTKTKRRSPINKALFETWAVNLSMLSSRDSELVIRKKQTLKTAFIDKLDTDESFLHSISSSTSNLKNIAQRLETIREILKDLLR